MGHGIKVMFYDTNLFGLWIFVITTYTVTQTKFSHF